MLRIRMFVVGLIGTCLCAATASAETSSDVSKPELKVGVGELAQPADKPAESPKPANPKDKPPKDKIPADKVPADNGIKEPTVKENDPKPADPKSTETKTPDTEKPKEVKPDPKPDVKPESKPEAKPDPKEAKPPKEYEKLTAQQESRAWMFVTEQHPDLADVLSRLKTTDAIEYDKALRQILVTSDRIAQLAKSDPPRCKLELRQWKVESRIRLLAAHMSLTPAEASEGELRAALTEQVQVKLELLELDRAKAEAKLKTVEGSIAKLKSGMDKEVEARLTELRAEIAKANKPDMAARETTDPTPK